MFEYVILSQTARRPHLVGGRSPRTNLFSYEWHESPNTHFLIIHDVEVQAAREQRNVARRIFLSGDREINLVPNLLAELFHS